MSSKLPIEKAPFVIPAGCCSLGVPGVLKTHRSTDATTNNNQYVFPGSRTLSGDTNNENTHNILPAPSSCEKEEGRGSSSQKQSKKRRLGFRAFALFIAPCGPVLPAFSPPLAFFLRGLSGSYNPYALLFSLWFCSRCCLISPNSPLEKQASSCGSTFKTEKSGK